MGMALSRLVRRIMPVSALPEKCLIAVLVELDVTSIIASCGLALPEGMGAVMTPNAVVAHVVLMELARLFRSQQWIVMGVALGEANTVSSWIPENNPDYQYKQSDCENNSGGNWQLF